MEQTNALPTLNRGDKVLWHSCPRRGYGRFSPIAARVVRTPREGAKTVLIEVWNETRKAREQKTVKVESVRPGRTNFVKGLDEEPERVPGNLSSNCGFSLLKRGA